MNTPLTIFNVNTDFYIVKKNGTKEKWNPDKIIIATGKSAARALITLSTDDEARIVQVVLRKLVALNKKEFSIKEIHTAVELALDSVNPEVAKQYRNFRNYKNYINTIMEEVITQENRIRYLGDKSNANKDGNLVATKRSLILGEWSSRMYEKFQLTNEELEASKKGYIYVHDKDSRRDTFNCCLFDIKTVFSGGFEMGNMWYNEPNSLDTAFDVMGDVILATAAQQYGGFTIPEIDTFLEPYAEKSYKTFYQERYDDVYQNEMEKIDFLIEHKAFFLPNNSDKLEKLIKDAKDKADVKAKEYALKKTQRECEQGMQGIEYKLNTVGSSRGDYPFTTFTLGLATGPLGKMIAKTIFNVRKNGEGKKGFKKPVLFPKLAFLYDEDLHGKEKSCEDVFETAIDCSSKCMYPDFLSLTGEGYVPSMYKKYMKVVSPMGCRAFLSPWYEKGGIKPADENDKPVFIGRFNLGVVTLHLPMILAKAKAENKDFYKVLDYYMELTRGLHKRTIEYLGHLKASCNPTCFCEGGLYGGHLKPNDKIAPILKPCTISFGYTALNELQQLYNGKSIREDGKFALEVMRHMNDKINEYKEDDGILYAIYGTPGESLCGKQIEQFRKKYGVIENVSSREYTNNSFHDPVWESITPIEKQNDEKRFWDLSNGGKIQYCKYPVQYNKEAIKTLVRRAMKLGFYEGVNLELSYCNHCGHEELDMDICPICGSRNITSIDRMNGYLGFSRTGTVNGEYDFDSGSNETGRFNKAKSVEISERVSM